MSINLCESDIGRLLVTNKRIDRVQRPEATFSSSSLD